MEFLIKHFEKLIFSFFMVCVLVALISVTSSLKSLDKIKTDEKNKAERAVAGGDKVEEFHAAEVKADKFLNAPLKRLNILGSKTNASKGSLIESNKMIMCMNEECNRLLNLSASKCPFCGTELPELGKESEVGDDADQDGLPDLFEKKYTFLNYRDPRDARYDNDQDGFLNIEEYHHQTKLDDKDDFPNLAVLLRSVRVVRGKLPVKLIDIDKNRTENKSKWDIRVSFFDTKTRKMKNSMKLIGDEAAGYKIEDAGFDGENRAYCIVSSVSNPQEKYRLIANEDTMNKNLTVQLMYLSSRTVANAQFVMRRSVMVKTVGDEITLSRQKSTGVVNETYRITYADETEQTVKVALLNAPGGAAEKSFDIPKFNYNEDFIQDGGSMGDDRMMEPGMMNEGMPGRGGRNLPGARPGVRR